MNTVLKCTAIGVLFCGCALREAVSCTAIVVGRKASATGRVLIGHNEDVGGAFMRHAMLPAKDGNAEVFWSEAKKTAGGDKVGALVYSKRGVFVISNNGGVMRSWDGETFALPEEGSFSSVMGDGIGYELRFRAVERAHTARECLDIMIALVEKHGYNQYSRNFLVADSSEAWILEVLYGRRYVARRVPDDGVVVYPNCLIFNRLREGDLASENIRAKGADFDVIGSYQGPRTWKSPYNLYRWMETYRTVAGVSLSAGDEYPFSVRPARAVSTTDIKRALCSHYEGRPFEVKERHPEKNPKIVVPVCRNTTVQSLVCEMGSVPEETVMHMTVGRPCEVGYRVYRPFGKVLPEDTVFGEEALWRLKNRELPASAILNRGTTGGQIPALQASVAEASRVDANRRRILGYLQSLPKRSEKKMLSGQQCEAWPRIGKTGLSDLEKVYAKTGKWPAVGGFEYCEMKGSRTSPALFKPPRWCEVNPYVKAYAAKGAIITISAHMANPWTGSNAWDCTDRGRIDELTGGESPARKAYWRMVEGCADGLEDLQKSGVVVLWRPFHELEGNWFWWGGEGKCGGRSAVLKKLWREMHGYMTERRGLKNLVWVFNGNACHYPGDDVVDLNSADIYGNDVGRRVARIIPKLASNTLKPFALGEFGPDWKKGHDKKYDFSGFVDAVLSAAPNCVYFLSWTGPWSLWHNDNSGKVMSDPRVVTLEDLGTELGVP